MKTLRQYIKLLFFIGMLSSLTDLKAQSENNFEKLQGISIEKTTDTGKKVEHPSSNLPTNPFVPIGNINPFDTSWGDPIANPEIRANRASNLYGPVRQTPNGSIRWHQGFDYTAPKGTPILSVGQGSVSFVENHSSYGLCVLVMHKRQNKTYYSFYAHLSSIRVKRGQSVSQGTVLGKSGTTGNARNLTGKEQHLHFEYRTNPKHGAVSQADPNTIVKTKFYSADPQNRYQTNVGVVKKSFSLKF